MSQSMITIRRSVRNVYEPKTDRGRGRGIIDSVERKYLYVLVKYGWLSKERFNSNRRGSLIDHSRIETIREISKLLAILLLSPSCNRDKERLPPSRRLTIGHVGDTASRLKKQTCDLPSTVCASLISSIRRCIDARCYCTLSTWVTHIFVDV